MNAKSKTILKKVLIIAICVVVALGIIYIVLGLIPRSKNYKSDNPMMKEGDLPA